MTKRCLNSLGAFFIALPFIVLLSSCIIIQGMRGLIIVGAILSTALSIAIGIYLTTKKP